MNIISIIIWYNVILSFININFTKNQRDILFNDIIKDIIKDVKVERILDFSLINLKNPSEIYIYTIIYNKKTDKSKLVLSSLSKKDKYIYYIPKQFYTSVTFQHEKKLYVFSENLYTIDLESFNIDSINLRMNDYNVIRIQKLDKSNILVASNKSYIDIYNFPELKLIKSIKRDKEVKYDKPIVQNGILYFKTKENVLKAIDIQTTKIVWIYDFGESDFYWLGVKVGKGINTINDYKIVNNYLYASTGVGDIAKLDITHGNIIIKREKFKGKENNAGLITKFSFFDINNDGIDDIIGPAVDHNIYCLDGKTLNIIWEYNTGYENQMPVSLYDITGDNILEVFSVNDEMKLSIIDGKQGKLIEKTIVVKGIKNGEIQSDVYLADVDGNSLLDILVKAGKDRLKLYELNKVIVKPFSVVYIPD